MNTASLPEKEIESSIKELMAILGLSREELGKRAAEFHKEILDAPKNVSRYDDQGIIVWFKKEKEWKAVKILFFNGAKLDQTDNTEFYMVNGSKLTIKIAKVPFTSGKVAWWASVDQFIAAYENPTVNASSIFSEVQ